MDNKLKKYYYEMEPELRLQLVEELKEPELIIPIDPKAELERYVISLLLNSLSDFDMNMRNDTSSDDWN